MRSDEYLPLEGSLRGPLYSSRLYIGRNHLLKSTISGIHENYRRFAWEDIQAFTLYRTAFGAAINAVLAIILFCLFMSFMTWHANLSRSLLIHGSFFILTLIALAWNVLLGPTCQVRVHTAVSDEWLGSLHREKLARRVLDHLRRIVNERQMPVPESIVSDSRMPAAESGPP